MECDGREKHFHYNLSTGDIHLHSHPHTVMDEKFNRLHHHAPIEHENLTYGQLTQDDEILESPF